MQKEKTTVGHHSKNDLSENIGNTARPERKTEVARKTKMGNILAGDRGNKVFMEIDDKIDAKTNKTAATRGRNANPDLDSEKPSFAMSQAAISAHTKEGGKKIAKKQFTKSRKMIDKAGIDNNKEIQPKDRQLTIKEIQLIAENWQYLENTYGLQKVGSIILKQVFQEDQSILQLLPYCNDQNPLKSEQFLKHALYVAQCIGQSIEQLSNLDGQAKKIKDFGRQLMHLGVQQDHYKALRKGLMNTLAMGLQQQLTKDA